MGGIFPLDFLGNVKAKGTVSLGLTPRKLNGTFLSKLNGNSVLISKTKTEKANPAAYCGDQD